MIALFVMAFQNIGNVNMYCLGSYSCSVTNTTTIFILKFFYILFWTWILNLICRAGAPEIAWFLILIPFILMFILIAVLFLSTK